MKYIIEDLCNRAQELGFEIEFDDVDFDTSRVYGLYVYGRKIGLPVKKFGAWRDYLGGFLRGSIQNSSQFFKDEKVKELAIAFEKALKEIESLEYYDDFAEHVEDWV